MPGLTGKFKVFGKRQNQTNAAADVLKTQIADLTRRLSISDELVLQLRRGLETLGVTRTPADAPTDSPPTDIQTNHPTAGLREERVNRTTHLRQRYDHVCNQLAERAAQAADLKVCIADLKELAATHFERATVLEARLCLATQRIQELGAHIQGVDEESQARANRIERAQQRLGLAEQRALELTTRLRETGEEGRTRDSRIRQMMGRLGLAGQRALELRTRLGAAEDQVAVQDKGIRRLEEYLKLESLQQRELRAQFDQEKDHIKYHYKREIRELGDQSELEKRNAIELLKAEILQKDNKIRELEEKLKEQQPPPPVEQISIANIFVRNSGRLLSFHNVPIITTIKAFRGMVEERTLGSPVECTVLLYGGKELRKDKCNYPPVNRQLVNITLGLCPGLDFLCWNRVNGAPLKKVEAL